MIIPPKSRYCKLISTYNNVPFILECFHAQKTPSGTKTTWMFHIRKSPNGQNIVLLLQVANRTLGSKSYSIPGQTLFASPSSYSILIKGCLQRRQLWLVAYTSFQLTHMTHDDYAVWASKGNQETRKLLQYSQLCHPGYAPVHDGHHGSVVRIFVGLSWELYCQRMLNGASMANYRE